MSRTVPLSYGAVVNTKMSGDFAIDPATTTGLTLGYRAGKYARVLNKVEVTAGTVSLTDDATNSVMINRSSGVITATTGTPTDSTYVLYEVTTVGGAITVITDKRAAYG